MSHINNNDDKTWGCSQCYNWFKEGKDNCKKCNFDLNCYNEPKQLKMNTVSKAAKINVIETYFAEKGQRMSNLKKATIIKLDAIIAKFNIDVDVYILKIKNKRDEQIEQQRIQDDERGRRRRLKEQETQNLKIKWNTLTTKMKQICYSRLWEHKYGNQDEDIKNHNDRLQKHTNMMMNALIPGARNSERIAVNEFKVNGMNIITGYTKKIHIKEDDFKIMNEEDQQVYTYTDKFIIPIMEDLIKAKIKKTYKTKLVIVEDDEYELRESRRKKSKNIAI